jgi:signal peptidase I
MLQPKYIKQAKLLQKGVQKFLKYKADIISGEKLAEIQSEADAFDAAVKNRDKEQVKALADKLTKVCQKAVPESSSSGVRENLEVIFVAIVIAVGIRAYFLQPFKIPTGSMQPTLNGIVGYDMKDSSEYKYPSAPQRAWERIVSGRKHFNVTMEEDGELIEIVEKTKAKFFTYTEFHFQNPALDFNISSPLKTLIAGEDFGLGQLIPIKQDPNTRMYSLDRRRKTIIPKGTVLVKGYMETGDQVLVDKMSYHFRTPRRGEVYVFNTRNISAISVQRQTDMSGRTEDVSQHYIKRLVAVPGDTVSAKDGRLYIDGALATEPGIVRVGTDENYKPGYTSQHAPQYDIINGVKLRDTYGAMDYWSMGDNSGNSSDSRYWGPVPEPNLVGPALLVYWPFNSHWGLIK